jgi:hypothetical protein
MKIYCRQMSVAVATINNPANTHSAISSVVR